MNIDKAREILERGYAISKITDAIKAIGNLNEPGVYLYEAEKTLTVPTVKVMLQELHNALRDLHRGTEDELCKM